MDSETLRYSYIVALNNQTTNPRHFYEASPSKQQDKSVIASLIFTMDNASLQLALVLANPAYFDFEDTTLCEDNFRKEEAKSHYRKNALKMWLHLHYPDACIAQYSSSSHKGLPYQLVEGLIVIAKDTQQALRPLSQAEVGFVCTLISPAVWSRLKR